MDVSEDGMTCTLKVSSLIQQNYLITFKNITNSKSEFLESSTASFYYFEPITVTASGYQEGTTHYPQNTLDNDYSSRWSEDGRSGIWIQYELKEVKRIEQVKMAFYNGHRRRAYFEIHLSVDGVSFTKVLDAISSGTSKELETFDFPDQQAKFVKIIGKGNSSSSWNSYTEVRIEYNNSIASVCKQPKLGSLKLYPNPCNNSIYLSEKVYWELFSVSSQRINCGRGDCIEMSNYKPGLYFIKSAKGIFKVVKR